MTSNEFFPLDTYLPHMRDVGKFDPARIIDTPLAFTAGGMLVPQLIKANQGRLLLPVVDLDYLFGMLSEPPAEAVEVASVLSAL